MRPDFGKRRRAFRVNVCNARSLGPRLAVCCGLCREMLFTSESIYALGPGTQTHIDLEVFLWGETMQPSLTRFNTEPTQLNCLNRCHEHLGLFLIARRGSVIDTCGFSFAGACGKDLVELRFLGATGAAATARSVDIEEFVSCEGSFRAFHRHSFLLQLDEDRADG
eukprot:gnl/TRDRNA2_/TRDRNA2_79552_c0_seq1.p1 gnl/TRDRNA2_/TRDRNA2_79552_c0~~gnl/TRDRNA2_/TRDRNA2_79552_c0_seq1.p1  ORF type:complete len:166 (-),score=12.99 gnl/TRDRNA2_/TRDRNA2_79552_c0_seq1:18-515(-)